MNKAFFLGAFLPFVLSSAHADADVDIPGHFSGSVTLTSQYVFRGITQSDESPAVQGSLDWAHDNGLYLGVWGSSVDFNDGDEANAEFDLYGGYNFSYAGFDFGLGGIYYTYPGADSALNYDFFEIAGSVGYNFDVLAVTGNLNYSPEYFGDSGSAYYSNLVVDVPLNAVYDGLALSGSIGYQDIEDDTAFGVPDYIDWSIGLGAAFQGFDLSLMYKDTDLSTTGCSDGCDAAVILSISKSLN